MADDPRDRYLAILDVAFRTWMPELAERLLQDADRAMPLQVDVDVTCECGLTTPTRFTPGPYWKGEALGAGRVGGLRHRNWSIVSSAQGRTKIGEAILGALLDELGRGGPSSLEILARVADGAIATTTCACGRSERYRLALVDGVWTLGWEALQ